MTSIACDIVLRPSLETIKLAHATSMQLQNQGTHFMLREGSFYAHASLYMIQLDLDMIEAVRAALQEIAETTDLLHLKAKQLRQQWGYVDVEYERNEAIDTVQNRVLEAINPLRDGLRRKDEERLKTAVGVELDNLKMYGYRSVGSEFAPHVTLTRFVEMETTVRDPIDVRAFDGTFTSIGVFEMGENGTCVRRLFEIPLQALA